MSRLMIAAAHKSSGKTTVSAGIAGALSHKDLAVQTFKKGPDYIDPMWLAQASGKPCYNLDFNTMEDTELSRFFANRVGDADVCLIESNKGLFDGVDPSGSDCNAALAQLLETPIVLVVDCVGITRGIAPLLQGYQGFAAGVQIAGVILNKTGGARHEGKLFAAVETYTDIPVLGAVANDAALAIGERHLGLTTPNETGGMSEIVAQLAATMRASINLGKLEAIAKNVSPIVGAPPLVDPTPDLRIAVARDTAFGFYYPDDLEAFRAGGAELVFFDALNDHTLPKVDGLFIGGGFPETKMAGLAANTPMRGSIRAAINAGMPTYAECGGLMYLAETIRWKGETYPMVGAVPGNAVMYERPVGRGYARFCNSEAHPWGGSGDYVNAHEFHYAGLEDLPAHITTVRKMTRGTGIGNGTDGVVIQNLLAGFCHLRNTVANPWVSDFLRFVRAKKR